MHTFQTAGRIIYGRGSISQLSGEAARLGRKALLVTGMSSLKRLGVLDKVISPLQCKGVEVVLFNKVEAEPSIRTVELGIEEARRHHCDLVISIGGGSAIDVGKVVAGLVMAPGSVKEYFLGEREIVEKGLPFIAIPTTAGTGAEVTMNSVLTDPEELVKQSIRSPFLLADVALVDPELTLTLPPHITAYSGMDALTQAIEGFTSKGAGPVTDALALRAAELIGRNLLRAYEVPGDIEAREALATGSLMAGMAFASARLGAVHGLAHPIGVRYHKPHGLVCAVLLPGVMRFNLPVVTGKYAEVAAALGAGEAGTASAAGIPAEAGIRFIEHLLDRLGIPRKLSGIGLVEEDIAKIAEEALPSGSTKANPRDVTHEDLVNILRQNL
ncbi:MAG: iron-containing alcohol dehydrogenase [Firmicutes bacterium]|nr:iron-containing alcohol dehydrogenase [Bacillota bacterium]